MRTRLRHSEAGFTLVEMMVALAIFVLLITFVGQLFSTAGNLSTHQKKGMDADSIAYGMIDRLAIDIAQMVKRPDLSYYLKDSTTTQPGNDQLAFFSNVPGYSSSTEVSPVSLVAYRVNSATMSVERLGKGLAWNGEGGSDNPMVFLPLTIQTVWPQATDNATDSDYEVIAPSAFRFEYYYLLKGQIVPSGTSYPAVISTVPWDTRIAGHTSANGLQDVSGIGVTLAVLDPGSRSIVSNAQLTALSANMVDASDGMAPGQLETQWNSAIGASNLPAVTILRIYDHMYYLNPSAP